MKKIILAFAMLAGSMFANAAEIKLAKTTFEVVAGGTVTIPIQLDLNTDEVGVYKTFQLDAVLSNSNFSLSSVTMASERKVASVADQYLEQIAGKTFGIVGMKNAAVIMGASGDFLYLTISAASATSGESCTVTFSKAKGGNTAGVETDATCDLTATINVVDYVTIDENEAFEPFALSGKDVKLIRSFEAGKFYSVVLPFDINNATRKAFWGSDVEAYVLNGCTFNEDTDEMIVGVTFNFTKAGNKTTLTAHVPFLVKPSQTVEDGTFTSVTMSAVSGVPQQSYADKGTGGGSGYGSNIVFVGTYAPETVVPTDALYLKGSMLYSSTGGTKMKGTRAYIDLSDVYAKLDEYILTKDFVMSFDGEETAIDQIDADLKAEGWYDLNGRKLAEKPTMKGIYINNGKKVVVK